MRTAVSRIGLPVSHFPASRPLITNSQRSIEKGLSRANSQSSRARGIINTMAPTEPEAFEYIVIGGGSGGSGTVRFLGGWLI
jgi:hypothetical protein